MSVSEAYACAKCRHSEFEVGEIRTTGKYSRFLNVQNKKFTTISCAQCGFTEIYRGDTSKLANVLDFLGG